MLFVLRWKTVEYFMVRSRANLQIIEKLDLIGQTSEFARIYGIEFYDVLNRGSQVSFPLIITISQQTLPSTQMYPERYDTK